MVNPAFRHRQTKYQPRGRLKGFGSVGLAVSEQPHPLTRGHSDNTIRANFADSSR